ncbi:MAG: polymer-forming cytoskeletal protein [Chloroflexi bacterium]|nr:polymer-forming cytoskeletal protein [Chloroflexota bacterium]
MFGKSNKVAPRNDQTTDRIETILGVSSSFSGHLKTEGGVRIDGVFEGTLESAGNIIIGQGARISADITAQNVTVAGAVKGNITATGRLEILAEGQVWGDISVASLLIDEGGYFRGMSVMPGDKEPPMLEAPRNNRRVKDVTVINNTGNSEK